ncbi:MAG: hypothetical protein J6Y79_02520 [Paludibacteraceae bacterium]|nr:hypothetical protein [Paludibacteraceae bacterium]
MPYRAFDGCLPHFLLSAIIRTSDSSESSCKAQTASSMLTPFTLAYRITDFVQSSTFAFSSSSSLSLSHIHYAFIIKA